MRYFPFIMAVILYSIGMMGTRILVPLVADDLNISATKIGIIVALFSLLPLVISIHIGKMIDEMNFRLPIFISIFFAGIGLSLPFLFQNIISISISQIISGVSHTFFIVSCQRYAGLAFGKQSQDYSIVKFSLGMAVGSFIGPFLAGLFSDLFNFYISYGILGLISISALIFSFNLSNETIEPKNIVFKKENSLRLLKNKHLQSAIIMSTIVLFAKEIFIAFFPLYASNIGYSSSTIGIIVSLHTLAAIIIRYFMEVLIDLLNEQRLIFILIIISVFSFAIIPFISNIVLLTLNAFILGLGLGLGQPLSIILTIRSLSEEKAGEGLGLRITFNRFTQVLSPIALGGMANLFGMKSLFIITALAMTSMQMVKSIFIKTD